MAERRMFAKTIIDSDAFLDMQQSAQLLYFHLSMRADDEGFINKPKTIMRMVGAKEDDLRILAARKFIIPFETGIVVIKHWRIHNYIRGDRLQETKYKEERGQLAYDENGAYTMASVCQSNDSQVPATCQASDIPRLGKDRLGKGRTGKESTGEGRDDGADAPETAAEPPATPRHSIDYESIKSLYNSTCKSFPRCTAMSEARKKSIKARFSSGYTMEDLKAVFAKAEASSFLKGRNDRNWTASFDWLIKDANMAKVLDGNYDDHHPGKGGPPNGRLDDLDFIPN